VDIREMKSEYEEQVRERKERMEREQEKRKVQLQDRWRVDKEKQKEKEKYVSLEVFEMSREKWEEKGHGEGSNPSHWGNLVREKEKTIKMVGSNKVSFIIELFLFL